MGIQNAFHVEPTVIPNGIDTDFFTPGTTTPDSDPRFRLLFVGNPTKRKGADLLEPLMSRLGSDYVLEYTSGLRDSGVISGPNVLPLGSLDKAAVREAYRRADAFVFPTRLEGLPLTVLKAMGSDRTSMPEAVTDGREGFLRPPEIEPLAAAIGQLRADDETRNRMGRAARERAVREF
jgi:glycosyltransferase involved in cell wall biosynthesis